MAPVSLSFFADSLNVLLVFFVFIGFPVCVVNNRLSGVRFVLVAKYCFMYFMASSAMKVGWLPNLPFSISLGMVILQGVGVSVSNIFSICFILSCFIVCGLSPACAIVAKIAFSLMLVSAIILLISSFSMSLLW